MSFITDIHSYIKKHTLIPPNSRIIIGLSGGPDSIFLTHFLASVLRPLLSFDLIAAHLDHEWRPESAQEVQFCADFCSQLNIPFVSAKRSQLALPESLGKSHGSKEAQARAARRFFFEHVRVTHKAQLIALAHHAQDQEETFFIRLIRGAGTAGLASMYPKKGVYIRPLLETNKSDILNYLECHAIPYLTDPTNVSLDFLRNRIRHLVIPALHTADPRFDRNFRRTIDNLQTTEHFLTQTTQSLFDTITTRVTTNFVTSLGTDRTEEKILLNSTLFQQQHELMQHRILMHFLITNQVPFTPTDRFLQEIIRFISHPDTQSGPPKTHRIHSAWQLVKTGTFVFIEKHD